MPLPRIQRPPHHRAQERTRISVSETLDDQLGQPRDRFLRYEVDSPERNAEYNVLHDSTYRPDDPKLQRQLSGYRTAKADIAKVDMQGKSKTVTRAVVLALVLVGQLGCIVLVGWLAFKVLLQGLITLVLLLLAPVMLLTPAFGDGGRSGFRKWALRLMAAIVSKAIYALFLALVLAVAARLTRQLGVAGPRLHPKQPASRDGSPLRIRRPVWWWGPSGRRARPVGWRVEDPAHRDRSRRHM